MTVGTGLGHQLRGAQHLIYGSLPCRGLQILFGQPLCSHGWETFFFFSLWCSMTAELSYIPCDRRSLPAPLENGFLLLAESWYFYFFFPPESKFAAAEHPPSLLICCTKLL